MESKSKADIDDLTAQFGSMGLKEEGKVDKPERKAKKGPYTHMVGIPIDDATIMENVQKFQERCAELNTDVANHPEWNKKIGRFHFTIMLIIADSKEKLDLAKLTLQGLKPKILELLNNEALKINLKGVKHFTAPRCKYTDMTRVLWTEMSSKETKDLYLKLSDLVIKALLYNKVLNEDTLRFRRIEFDKEKMMFKASIPHMTLLNSNNEPGTDGKTEYESKEILDEFKDHDFGTLTVDRIGIFESDDSDLPYVSSFELKLDDDSYLDDKSTKTFDLEDFENWSKNITYEYYDPRYSASNRGNRRGRGGYKGNRRGRGRGYRGRGKRGSHYEFQEN